MEVSQACVTARKSGEAFSPYQLLTFPDAYTHSLCKVGETFFRPNAPSCSLVQMDRFDRLHSTERLLARYSQVRTAVHLSGTGLLYNLTVLETPRRAVTSLSRRAKQAPQAPTARPTVISQMMLR